MLEVKNLVTKIDEKKILKSINIKVEKGEVIGLIGQTAPANPHSSTPSWDY